MRQSIKKSDRGNLSKKRRIILYGLIVHFLLLFAVFDIYFASPLDRGMKLIKSTSKPPAKRLVLFVADGLRAEAVYGKKADNIPFLTDVLRTKGSWGTAHTRVPTESRPGHVAMLAGIYEDPSAIFKGWKANPVNFDSVLNQSTHAWCWGSPDILTIFKKDTNVSHIQINTYSAEKEDFGNEDTTLLDEWVLTRAEKFLKSIETCDKDCDKFYEAGNIFFLHLLGIDTAGHGFKPNSNEYTKNIKFVDENVKKISQLFQAVFKDNKTAFIFTSDHGMTDWGSHGAGSAHETEAPIVAWGAGIKRNPRKTDVKQIDVAPLLATLVGLNIPSNSLGVVPLDFLDLPEEDLADVQLSNTLQLLETFNIKRKRTEDNAVLFLPYRGLTTTVLDEKIEKLIQMKNLRLFQLLISTCSDLMVTLIDGLDYYHNYYQYPLLICISLGLVEWIFYLLTASGTLNSSERVGQHRKILVPMLILLPIILCYIQHLPLSYYLYFTFPCALFCMLHPHFQDLIKSFGYLKDNVRKEKGLNIVIYVLGIELLVFGFFNRTFISVLCLLIGIWVFFSDSLKTYTTSNDKLIWVVLCCLLSIFPMFPVMKTTFNIYFYILGSVTWILLFLFMLKRLKTQHRIAKNKINYNIFYIQFLALILAVVYNVSLELGFISNNSSLKCISWFLLVIPIAIIPFSSKSIATRLLATFFGFAPFYLLVSSNYEAVFSAIYVANLYNWLSIESKTLQSDFLIYFVDFDSYASKDKINAEAYRRAFLFMVYIFVGFFGTGNIASLNSFDPMWVRAFLTVFSPFKMMGLILMKIMVPFLFACCIFRAINRIGKENVLQTFSIILFFSDLMVLQFLYMITNKGSWLDIGSSLSHFIIMEAFVTILLLLYGFAHLLTSFSYLKISRPAYTC